MNRIVLRALALAVVLVGYAELAWGQTTYWMGRKVGNDQMIYDVKVPTCFGDWITARSPQGTPQTINNTSYQFHTLTVTWDNGGANPKGSGQIRIDSPGAEGWVDKPPAEWLVDNKDTFRDELYKLAPAGQWQTAKNVSFIKTADANNPKLTITLQTTTYWMGRNTGNDQIVYDVKVPDFFGAWISARSPQGSPKTINGTSYEFHTLTFTWHNGGSNPKASGQILIDSPGKAGWEGRPAVEWLVDNKDTFRDELYKYAPPGDWQTAKNVTFLKTANANNPNVTVNLVPKVKAPYDMRLTVENVPQIVAVPNSDGSIDICWSSQDNSKIYVHRTGNQLSPTANSMTKVKEYASIGALGGYAKSGNDGYVMMAEPNKSPSNMKIIKTRDDSTLWGVSAWEGFRGGAVGGRPLNGLCTCRMEVGGGKLLAAFGMSPEHPFYVLLDTNKSNLTTKPHETFHHHTFDQRVLWDGKDFVVLENRDHDVSTTLMKVKTNEGLKQNANATEQAEFAADGTFPLPYWVDKVRSIYARSNFGNAIYAHLGGVQNGCNDDGYLVLLTSERDVNYQFQNFDVTRWSKTNTQPHHFAWNLTMFAGPNAITSPRDALVVHVKKNFDATEQKLNWTHMACPAIDTSPVIDSQGASATITYRTRNDGWVWERYNHGDAWIPGELMTHADPVKTVVENAMKEYKAASDRGDSAGQRAAAQKITTAVPNWPDFDRTIKTTGVNWLTSYGGNSGQVLQAANGPNGTLVPADTVIPWTAGEAKLVRISANNYIALWEEHQNSKPGFIGAYARTRACRITLGKSGSEVTVSANPPGGADIGPIRLRHHSDPIAWNGGVAVVDGDAESGNFILKHVTADLKVNSYTLQPSF